MCPNASTIRAITPPCAKDMNKTDIVVKPSSKYAIAKIIESGPKNTSANVAIASAMHIYHAMLAFLATFCDLLANACHGCMRIFVCI